MEKRLEALGRHQSSIEELKPRKFESGISELEQEQNRQGQILSLRVGLYHFNGVQCLKNLQKLQVLVEEGTMVDDIMGQIGHLFNALRNLRKH